MDNIKRKIHAHSIRTLYFITTFEKKQYFFKVFFRFCLFILLSAKNHTKKLLLFYIFVDFSRGRDYNKTKQCAKHERTVSHMPMIFSKNGFIAKGNVLPLKDFILFRDANSWDFNPRHADVIVKEAEALLEKDIPLLPLSLFREFSLTGNRSNFQEPYRFRRNMALTLALAEKYEGKGRFIEKLCDVVWAIMEESTWIIPAHTAHNPILGPFDTPPVYGDNTIHGIDLFSATTCATLSIIYYFCHDAMDSISPVICKKLLYMLHDRAIKPYLLYTFKWSGEFGNKPNNWCPWIVSNVLLTMALTTEDLNLREQVTQRAMKDLDCFTREYNDDGGCDEGPSYWGAAGASYFDALETIYDITGGAIEIYSEPLVRAIGEYIVKFNINGKRFVNFADCPPSTVPDGCMIRRFGEKVGSDIMPPFGDVMNSYDGQHFLSQYHVYRALRNLITPDSEAEPPKAAKKVWFPNLKVMTTRESEDPAKGLFLAIKGGHNAESHNHNDVGNFVVYYNGNPVIIDTGVGTYTKQTFSSRRYELWYMQSSYHNLPDINGVAQKNGLQYRSKNELYDETSPSLQLELADAYLPEADVRSFVRRAELGDGEIRVTDKIELGDTHEVVFHIMTHVKPEIAKEGTISLAEGRTLTYDTRLDAVIEEFPVNDNGMKKNWNSETLFRINFTASIKKDEFVFVIK